MFQSFINQLPHSLVLLSLSVLVSADVSAFVNSEEYQAGVHGNYTLQRYVSEPHIRSPVANILVRPEGASAEQYIIWSPVGPQINGHGPSVLDANTMELVYQGPSYNITKHGPGFGIETLGATVQTCNNTDYLTWWTGQGIWGRKAGNHYMHNAQYDISYNITPIGLDWGDAHEFILTPECHAIITAYQPRPWNLTEYNETLGKGHILESYFQEIDLATNTLLFQWRASDHVAVSDSYLTYDMAAQGRDAWDGYDYFHINSVQKDSLGNYLVSSRHMHALYYVNGKDGSIFWTLGGKRNDFIDLSGGNATNFAWQHHARWTDDLLQSISLFDNRNAKYEYAADPVSRGVILTLDYAEKTVRLAKEYRAPDNITAIREGSMQLLSSPTSGEPNVLLGWGNEPGFTEYSASGSIVWDVRLGPLDLDRVTADNYRALKVNWTGTPSWAPKIATGPADFSGLVVPGSKHAHAHADAEGDVAAPAEPAHDALFFSWNGATLATQWLLLGAPAVSHSPSDFIPAADSPAIIPALTNISQALGGIIPKTGFETSFLLSATTQPHTRYVRAVALAANGSALAASGVLDVLTNAIVNAEDAAQAFNVTAFNAQLAAFVSTSTSSSAAAAAATAKADAQSLSDKALAALRASWWKVQDSVRTGSSSSSTSSSSSDSSSNDMDASRRPSKSTALLALLSLSALALLLTFRERVSRVWTRWRGGYTALRASAAGASTLFLGQESRRSRSKSRSRGRGWRESRGGRKRSDTLDTLEGLEEGKSEVAIRISDYDEEYETEEGDESTFVAGDADEKAAEMDAEKEKEKESAWARFKSANGSTVTLGSRSGTESRSSSGSGSGSESGSGGSGLGHGVDWDGYA